jgi:hypothetical protein
MFIWKKRPKKANRRKSAHRRAAFAAKCRRRSTRKAKK